jgi:chaperone required for assembly of F1-ATPase
VNASKNNKVVVPLSEGVGAAAEVTLGQRWLEATTYRFDSVRDARNYCSALERQMRLSGLRDVLVDARKHERQTREASEAIWHWVDTCSLLERMAIINESENLALAIRMRNLASPKRKVRPFHSKLEAEKWLLSGSGADGR